MKRDGGINLLSRSDQEACRNLFGNFAEYGIFIVECGELESWLPEIGAGPTKSAWLLNIFEKMGDDPADSGYVRPGQGDVWDFIGDIKHWVTDSNRKGIPE